MADLASGGKVRLFGASQAGVQSAGVPDGAFSGKRLDWPPMESSERPQPQQVYRHPYQSSSPQETPRWLVVGVGLFVCLGLVCLVIFAVTQIVDVTRPEATTDSNGRACIEGGNERLPDCK